MISGIHISKTLMLKLFINLISFNFKRNKKSIKKKKTYSIECWIDVVIYGK